VKQSFSILSLFLIGHSTRMQADIVKATSTIKYFYKATLSVINFWQKISIPLVSSALRPKHVPVTCYSTRKQVNQIAAKLYNWTGS